MESATLAGRLTFCALPGPELKVPIERQLVDLSPSGVILFDRNIKSSAQLSELIDAIREVLPHPVLLAVDMEGGRVNRLKGLDPAFAAVPPGIEQASWNERQIEDVWELLGRGLAALGFDIDFHPPVDLDPPENLKSGIGNRSFGLQPGVVTRVAAAVLRGLSRAGVIGCLKHYPGLGSTDLDTHQALATSPHSQRDLWERHAAPYRDLRAEAPMVMTAHAHFPSIDGPDPLPATWSSRLIEEWLRDRIGFEGVVVSDDLEMGAVADGVAAGERARRALAAGCDLALFCKELDSPRYARERVAQLLERGDLSTERALRSLQRVAELIARFPGGRDAKRSQLDVVLVELADRLAEARR